MFQGDIVTMTQSKPVILHKSAYDDGWDDELRGRVRWRTLFSAEQTLTRDLTAGVAEIKPGNQLKVHRHTQPELYFLLSGTGVVTVDGEEYPVRSGSAVFIPGNSAHGLRNTGRTTLRFFYAFAVNSFSEVDYVFPG